MNQGWEQSKDDQIIPKTRINDLTRKGGKSYE